MECVTAFLPTPATGPILAWPGLAQYPFHEFSRAAVRPIRSEVVRSPEEHVVRTSRFALWPGARNSRKRGPDGVLRCRHDRYSAVCP
jgi:hypothetical protein